MAEAVKVGYVRVSSADQNEARQIEQMKALGIDDRNIFVDKQSGKDFNREKYNAMVNWIRPGDEIYISSLDRLGRNYREMADEWDRITKHLGAHIIVLDMPILDTRQTHDLTGTLIVDIVFKLLCYVAENERTKIRTRQAEGIAIARAAGKYTGRKPIAIDKPKFEEVYGRVRRGECTNKYAQKVLGLKPSTYYKAVNDYNAHTGPWEV